MLGPLEGMFKKIFGSANDRVIREDAAAGGPDQ